MCINIANSMGRLSQQRAKRSSTIGYKIDSNPGSINRTRDNYLELSGGGLNLPGGADGEGNSFGDILKKVVATVPGLYSSELGTSLKNALPSSDPNARPGFAGEKHAVLRLPNGKFGVGNYIGPGTALIQRLRRGDPPRTEVDKVSKAHDIRYALAETEDDIRKADNIMLAKVEDIRRRGADSRVNIAQAKLIKAKVLGENLGLLKRDAFSGDLSLNKKISQEDRDLMKRELSLLAPSGYGLSLAGGAIMRPGDELKLKILKKQAKQRKQGAPPKLKKKTNGESSKRDLTGQTYKLVGSGSMMSSADVHKFVSGQILPSLLKAVGVVASKVPIESIVKLTTKALTSAKSGDIEDIVGSLSKHILPFLTVSKLGGKGLKLAGQGMAGAGVFSDLEDKLFKGLLKAFKWWINSGSVSQGGQPVFKGSGLNLPGGSFSSFWKGFKKGFMGVVNPAISVAKTLAPVLPLLL